MTSPAHTIRPGDVIRLAAVSGRANAYRAPTKRDVARGKNNVLTKVHRVRVERVEDHESTGVRRESSVRMWIELVDGTTQVTMVGTLVDLDVYCGAKAPIDVVVAGERPAFPSDGRG